MRQRDWLKNLAAVAIRVWQCLFDLFLMKVTAYVDTTSALIRINGRILSEVRVVQMYTFECRNQQIRANVASTWVPVFAQT